MLPARKAHVAVGRRAFLQCGGIALGTMALPRASAEMLAPPAKRAIVILLQGGLSQIDSFDPKPRAPAEYRGEFDSIATSVPGTFFCEHLPRLAARAERFNVLRSVYHNEPDHYGGVHLVLTGYNQAANVADRSFNQFPAQGAVVAKLGGAGQAGLPSYVCIPDRHQLGNRTHHASAAYLGLAYDPLDAGQTPESAVAPYALPANLTLNAGVDAGRLDQRVALIRSLDRLSRRIDATGVMDGMDDMERQAVSLLTSGATLRAFDLNQESAALRERYGSHREGQLTILGRRLAEAGVPFTLINYSINQEWDTHNDGFKDLKRRRLPPFDQAFSALLDDLEERGLLETTVVAVITEFGRTPRVNETGGRDHWCEVFSMLLAGGGLRSGRIVGSSTSKGERPLDRPIEVGDVLATIYRQLGIPTEHAFPDFSGRPIPVLSHGRPIAELL